MPPMPPDYGVGPANVTNPGEISPFAGFDNLIRYQDMARHQMVSQYQQNIIQPAAMTLAQQRRVATEARFQYGVQGGQGDVARFYQRQAESRRGAFGAAVASGVFDYGLFETATAAAVGLGAKGFMATAVLPALPALPIAMGVGWGIQNTIKRQQFMHSMASDVEQYRDQLGFSSALTYGGASALGASLENMMESRKGGFFSKDQMARIHKIGLSNNLLTATSKGAGSGSLRQYERNVKELIDTTEGVVKMLQTTIEGGMSVINELRQTGIKDLGQIKQMVAQSKTIGRMTGLGSQNMMQVAAAGAQAAQGTPYSAATGAGLYQLGAMAAQGISMQTSRGAAAVDRVGGTANAGGVIGNFAMNVLSSGIGTRVMAYMMDPKTRELSDSKAKRFLSGRVGAHEIMTGSAGVGHALGPSGRYMFETDKANMINAMDPKAQLLTTLTAYSAWSASKPYITGEAKMQKFANDYSGSPAEAAVVAQFLKSGINFAALDAQQRVELQVSDPFRSKMAWGPTARFAQGAYKTGRNVFAGIGEDIYYAGTGLTGGSQWLAREVKGGLASMRDVTGIALGIYDKYGGRESGGFGDLRTNLEVASGLKDASQFTALGRERIRSGNISGADVARFSKSKIKWNVDEMLSGIGRDPAKAGNLNKAIQDMVQAITTGNTKAFIDSSSNMRAIGGPGSGSGYVGGMGGAFYNPNGASSWRKSDLGSAEMYGLLDTLRKKRTSLTSERENVEQQITAERNSLKNKSERDAYDALYQRMLIDPETRKGHEGSLRAKSASLNEQIVAMGALNIPQLSNINVAESKKQLSELVTTEFKKNGTYREFNALNAFMKSRGIKLKTKGGQVTEEGLGQTVSEFTAARDRLTAQMGTEADLKLFRTMGLEGINKIIEKGGYRGAVEEIKRRESLIPAIQKAAGNLTPEFQKDLQQVLSGEKNKKGAREFASKYAESLMKSHGLTTDAADRLISEGKGIDVFSAHLSNITTEKGKLTDPAEIVGELMRSANRLRDNLTNKNTVDNIYNPDGKMRSATTKKEKQEALDAVNIAIKQEEIRAFSRQAGLGGSLDAGIRTPVLNYWNNRWVL